MLRISNLQKFAIVRVVFSSPVSFSFSFFFFNFLFFLFFFFILLATHLPFTDCICRSRRVLITNPGASLMPRYIFLSDRWVSEKAKQ